MSHPSLAGRAALAVALMIGFYVLAISVAALLFLLPWLVWLLTHQVFVKLALGSFVAAAIVLWSIVPRPDRFEPPGPRLRPEAQPRLFREIEALADATGQPLPREVYLVQDVNAFVAQRGGVMGFGSRPVMGVGLPLLQLLTLAQFRAVLAHEFGHFHGSDTRLGPWIYKTRGAIGRTIGGLSERAALVRVPFEMYGNLFLRITHGISRRQELAADALGASVAGAAAMAQGLRVTHGAAPAFAAYWQSELAPLLDMGVLPPVADGLARFVRVEQVSSRMREAIDTEMREGKGDPYDTHPPLRERLAALGVDAAGNDDDETPPAISLLDDVAQLERDLLTCIAGSDAEKLESLDWEDVPERALRPMYGKAASEARAALAGVDVAGLHAVATRILEFERVVAAREEPLELAARRERGSWYLAASLTDALGRHGWTLESGPGQPITMRCGDQRIEPFAEMAGLVESRTPEEEWRARCASWGIAGLGVAAPLT